MASGRITVDHEPLLQLLLKLADSLEAATGQGTSVALLSAQFQQVWQTLARLRAPAEVVRRTSSMWCCCRWRPDAR